LKGFKVVDEQKNAFLIKKIREDCWEIDMEGNKVNVANKSEAKLISLIPVEFYKTYSDSQENPDISIIKKIIEVCDTYRINTFATRRLKAWLKKNIKKQ